MIKKAKYQATCISNFDNILRDLMKKLLTG